MQANNARQIADNGLLTADQTTAPVDLDQVFNTLDAPTRRALQQVIQGSAAQYQGQGAQANLSAHYFNPLLSTSAQLVNEAVRDQQAFSAFITSSSRVVTALEARRANLADLVTNSNTTAAAIGSQNVALNTDLQLLPVTLRNANTTFVNLRNTLNDLDVLTNASKPATKRLAALFADLRPLVAEAIPTIHDLRLLVHQNGPANDLTDLLLKQPALAREAKPAFADAILALAKSQPVLQFIGPTRRISSAGCATSARARPTTTPTATSPASSRSSTPTRSPPTRRAACSPRSPTRRRPRACRRATARAAREPPASTRPTTPLPSATTAGRSTATRRYSPRTMRRLALILGLIACVGTLAVLGTGAGSSAGYRVRAIFDNAFSVIPGEDVKIAGVKVGKIESLDVTPDQKAAVVLAITKPGFDDFRSDATCTIRPQSLIGEKFVECVPTQPRVQGAPAAPPLAKVPKGQPGAGEYLLPDTQTTRPVDIDLLGNVLRLPYRERLSIILNEFGTGLAGRGQDLRDVIRRADPALRTPIACSTCWPARTGSWTSWRSTPTPLWLRWPASARGWPTSSCRPTRPPRRRPSAARRSRPTSSACRHSSSSCSPRWSAWARCRTR